MESEKIQKPEVKQVQNPNRGMSKKERRRVDALSQKLEPRIKELEAKVSEQNQKLNLLSDMFDRKRNQTLVSRGAEERGRLRRPTKRTLRQGNHQTRWRTPRRCKATRSGQAPKKKPCEGKNTRREGISTRLRQLTKRPTRNRKRRLKNWLVRYKQLV